MNTTPVTAADPAAPKEGDGWYCVIGPTVNSNNCVPRSWRTTLDSAAAHAERLIKNSHESGSKGKLQKLLVVKVVEVIEVEGPPLVHRSGKDIRPDDVGIDDE